ncbi:MAG: response regulator [Acidobacteria bacterium]|nr:response regulator [Acidobacteriota bacterium]
MKRWERVVLVVDDDPDICWVLERLVESLKAKCIRALDCRSALQAVRLSRLDLVLLDAKLPDMDGLELARQIRRTAPGVPIMLISGYFYKDDPAVQAALEEELICGFAEKPFLHTAVIGAMKAALCSPEAAPGAAEPLAAC